MNRAILAFLVCALLAAFAAPSPARAAGGEAGAAYLSALDDVPLMAGLSEVEEAGVAFETPAGRLIEAEATGTIGPGVDARAVRAFYRAALPGLGWTPRGEGAFVRAAELLSIEARERGTVLSVRFSLKPFQLRR